MRRSILFPCPVHGDQHEATCIWCHAARYGSVRSRIRELLAAHLRTESPELGVGAFSITSVILQTLVVEVGVKVPHGPSVRRRFLLNAHGVLEVGAEDSRPHPRRGRTIVH
jgi:hypothetical protein